MAKRKIRFELESVEITPTVSTLVAREVSGKVRTDGVYVTVTSVDGNFHSELMDELVLTILKRLEQIEVRRKRVVRKSH